MAESNQSKTGKILWYSSRDQNGIILDDKGNEHYFDISVWKCPVSDPSSNRAVRFEVNTNISDCLCAHNVRDFLTK